MLGRDKQDDEEGMKAAVLFLSIQAGRYSRCFTYIQACSLHDCLDGNGLPIS